MSGLHRGSGNSNTFALRYLTDISILCSNKGVDTVVYTGVQVWKHCFCHMGPLSGKGQLAEKGRMGEESSVKGERGSQERGAGKSLQEIIHRGKERTRGKTEGGKHVYGGKRALNPGEKRASLEDSDESGAGDKGKCVRTPLAVCNVKKMAGSDKQPEGDKG